MDTYTLTTIIGMSVAFIILGYAYYYRGEIYEIARSLIFGEKEKE